MNRTLVVAALLSAGCQQGQSLQWPEPSWERMLAQPRVDPYEESAFFADRRAMRTPPAGTVPRDRVVGRPDFTEGRVAGRFVDAIPLGVDRALLEEGRTRFDVVCATCHGILGDGVSYVAANMPMRRPPSLHTDEYRTMPAGKLYTVVRDGYGLMPGYATTLDARQRWAVVAYVRALQLSQHAPAAALPPDARAQLEREAR